MNWATQEHGRSRSLFSSMNGAIRPAPSVGKGQSQTDTKKGSAVGSDHRLTYWASSQHAPPKINIPLWFPAEAKCQAGQLSPSLSSHLQKGK